ncbi:hypothetical protein DBR44_18810 [Aquitalea sp. FJL05]|uniref:hypothetical protein n=1 Tax=Aquitalea sp. FJL05 TaxID=2153366 RepID=UPI000F5AB43D|nr:hypothetical protein [Aquitalea sp. FJL05]RQO65754.1 hypothetical protein DBR44_18810 [Aquitalea sp. FJL05]
MNAAKKIRLLIDSGESPEQVQVLKEMAIALQMKDDFSIDRLYQIDQRYFDVAMDLLKEWRFDHHIASRSKLIDMLLPEVMPAVLAVCNEP